MLRTISIRNFALIDELELEFGPGLNIMTGETGAGKSIIIDAFLAALGERTSVDVIRSGQQRAVVELTFSYAHNSAVENFLKSHDFELLDDTLIIRRELSTKGSSRYFINDSPAQATVMRELGATLVDFHGQHEHQSILRPEHQLHLLDEVAQTKDLLEEYQTTYQELRRLVHTYEELQAKEHDLRERREFQRAQLDELEKIDARENEDLELERELALVSNAEELYAKTDEAYQALYASDTAARDALIRVQQLLHHLRGIDDRFADQCAEIDSVVITIDEVAKTVKRYNAAIEFQPERIETIRERLQVLHRLRKRYGSVQAAIDHRLTLQTELDFIDNFEQQSNEYRQRIAQLQIAVGTVGWKLSARRRKKAVSFDAAIVACLHELGIPQAKFQSSCRVAELPTSDESSICAEHDGRRYVATATGLDSVQFEASMNSGESLKSLEKVLSGGEASRIMLAVKSVIAAADSVPLLVFDEIDVGVSGRIARRVGTMMKKLAQSHQVIAITHQAQIASLGHHHISVTKTEVKGHTSVQANVVDGEARVREVAKLMSGESVTAATLKSASELMLDES